MKNKKDLIIIVLLIVNMFATGTVGFVAWRSNSNQSSNEKIQYTMYIGMNDKDTYEQIISTEDAKTIIDNICFKYLDGYTIQDANGSWVDENGLVTHENTIVCCFKDTDNDTVYKIADEVIKTLNQNTVLIEKDLIQIDFYSGKE